MVRYRPIIRYHFCMRSAKERRRYIVISSLIGGKHTQNDPWILPIPCRIISLSPVIVRDPLKLYLRIWATSYGSNKKIKMKWQFTNPQKLNHNNTNQTKLCVHLINYSLYISLWSLPTSKSILLSDSGYFKLKMPSYQFRDYKDHLKKTWSHDHIRCGVKLEAISE